MWMMLNSDEPGDYVIATGKTYSVRELLELAFSVVGLDPYEHLVIDPDLLRPAEIYILVGDCSLAREKLGWTYDLSFQDLVREMVEADIEYYSRAAGDRKSIPGS
jgi:GDPmannose 4,6-dehydratase